MPATDLDAFALKGDLAAPVLRLDDDIEITRETNILMDLDGDSLDVIETVIDIEEEFDCNIKEEDLESVITVGDLIDLVQNSMN